MSDRDQAAENPSRTCDHHWVHHHPANSPIWIAQCDLCHTFNVVDLDEQLAARDARVKAEALDLAADQAVVGRDGDVIAAWLRARAAEYREQATQ